MFGLQIGDRDPDGTIHLRMDDRLRRLSVHPGEEDRLAYGGWELAGKAAFNEAVAELSHQGSAPHPGTEEECEQRQVLGLARFQDPYGFTNNAAGRDVPRPQEGIPRNRPQRRPSDPCRTGGLGTLRPVQPLKPPSGPIPMYGGPVRHRSPGPIARPTSYCSALTAPPALYLHIHDTADELFFLLEGTLRVTFDDEQHEVGPGSFMFLPAGIPHAVKPVGETVPRLLQISVPGGFEHFIEDMVELQAKGKAMDLDSEEFREFSRKHDWTLLGSAGSADPNTDEPQAS